MKLLGITVSIALAAASCAGAVQAQASAKGQGVATQIAVAANFLGTARALARAFAAQTGHSVVLSSGSTGKLYAQIRNGAPYAVLLAADAQRPALLEQQGLAVTGTRFTYALGRLVLWSASEDLIDPNGEVLVQGRIARLAIANPRTAPYGAAARAVLEHLGIWNTYQARLVSGENVGQTLQFAATGNAAAAFVALAQVDDPRHPQGGSRWVVPAALYPPIEQQAVLLRTAGANATARAFLEFLRAPAGRALIESHGYGLP